MPRLFSFFLLFLLTEIPVKAQLSVAKDYNNCYSGLMDKNGKWVLAPRYTRISPCSNKYFILFVNEKYSVANQFGKVVIPEIDSSITEFRERGFGYVGFKIFEVYSKGKYGMMDSTGKFILPIIYESITSFNDSIAYAWDGKAKWFLINPNGICGEFPEWVKRVPSSLIKNVHLVIQESHENGKYIYRLGACNSKGEMIIPLEYDSIFCRDSYRPIIEAWAKGRETFYSAEAKIIGGKNCIVPNVRFNSNKSLMSEYGYSPEKSGDKWGMVGFKGDTIFKFEFDSIYYAGTSRGTYYYAFPVFAMEKDKKWGIGNGYGSWLVEQKYEQIKWNDCDNNSLVTYGEIWSNQGFCLVREKGLWGAMDARQNQIMPCESDTVFDLGNLNWLFWNNETPQLLHLKIEKPELIVYISEKRFKYLRKMRFSYRELYPEQTFDPFSDTVKCIPIETEDENYFLVPRSGNPYVMGQKWDPYSYEVELYRRCVFKVLKTEIVFSHNGMVGLNDFPDYNDSTALTNFSLAVQKDKAGIFHLMKKIEENKSGISFYTTFTAPYGIVSSEGKIIVPFSMKRTPVVANHQPLYFSASYSKYKSALVDENGNKILDTLYSSFAPGNNNLLWVSVWNCNSIMGWNECEACWQLFDVTTQNFYSDSLVKTVYPVLLNEPFVSLNTITGKGLFDVTKKKFVVKPVFADIIPINKPAGFFLVKTCSYNYGIINSNGKLLVDTVWRKAVRGSTTNITLNDSVSGDAGTIVLYNDSSSVVFKYDGTISSYSSEMKLYFCDAGINRFLITPPDQTITNCRGCAMIDLNNFSPDSLVREMIADEIIFRDEGISNRESQGEHCTCLHPISRSYWNNDAVFAPAGSYYYDYNDTYADRKIKLIFVSDSAITIENTYYLLDEYGGRSKYRNPSIQYTTLITTATGTQTAVLDSFFTGTHWRNTISNYVMNYLREHPTINADCSNPSAWSTILQRDFFLASDGLHLLPNWQYTLDYQNLPFVPEIIIPWNELIPDMRPGIASELGLK